MSEPTKGQEIAHQSVVKSEARIAAEIDAAITEARAEGKTEGANEERSLHWMDTDMRIKRAIAEATARGRREGSRSGLSLGDRALLEKFDRLADSETDGEAEMSEECKLYKHRYCVWQQCACDCHHDEGEAE